MGNTTNIRTMQPADLDFCVENVNREGWLSETRDVFEMFLAHDHNGCFVAEEHGTSIGICVATAYENSGFLGELIVVPEYRGHGIGRQLMKHAIAYLRGRGCTSVYLDGDLPAVPLYERLGFRSLCDSLRFAGSVESQTCKAVRHMTATDLPALEVLDREAFGADRSFLIRHKFKRYPDLARVVARREEIAGCIMGQPGLGVVTVGPWVADSSTCDPLDLLRDLAGHTTNTRLRIAVLDTNTDAVMRLRAIDTLKETQLCRRMVLGPDVNLGSSNRLWALGSAASG